LVRPATKVRESTIDEQKQERQLSRSIASTRGRLNVEEQSMRSFILAAGMTLALAAPSFAQSSQGQNSMSGQNPAQLRQQVRQNLADAGFTDIKVMPESFLVRAKDKSGNPVMMIINPDSVTAVTALTGTTSGNSMAGSQALNLTQQQRQKIAQAVANQPAEQAPANFQASVGQKVPSSLTLKSFPSSAQSELPASLQGDQYAKLNNNDIIIVDPSNREVVGVVNQNGAD
jgi:hypothetical protein